MQYLDPKQTYEDRYDLLTIEECLEKIEMLAKIGKKMRSQKELKKIPESEHTRSMGLLQHWTLFPIKGVRFKNRASTIAKWMEADRVKQDKLDNTPLPIANCPECNDLMVDDGYRQLVDWRDDEKIRVLFTFRCHPCDRRRGVYEDGELYVSDSDLCPECKNFLKVTTKKKARILKIHYSCKYCGHSHKETNDLKKMDKEHEEWQKEHDERELKEKQLLETYRAEFCLSEKEGKEYVETLEALEVADEVRQEILAEMDTPAHDKLLSVQRLSISDLEALVNKALEESGFTRLSFSSPEIDRHVLVPFTVQETRKKRRDRESISDLYNLLKNTLKQTNWRAPKDFISYRLGFLSGSLRGYESEEDLLKLFGKEEPKKPKSKLDPKLRAKYEHHNLVNLARLQAKFKATERIRTRRLKDEPEGFFLNDGGRGYSCGICRRSHDGGDIWWRPDGLRCRDCWRNIQEGIIPVLDLRKEWWEEEFFDKYDIKNRGIKSASIRKLRREGILVGRDLKEIEGRVYWTVYLVSENKKFIGEYPIKKSGT